MRAHEPVRPCNEHRPVGVGIGEILLERAQLRVGPRDLGGFLRAQDFARVTATIAEVRLILARLRQRDTSYEPELQAAITRLVRPGWTCADVGAHHGVFTRLLADLVGEGGRVVAFEAHPGNAQRLRKSLGNGIRDRVVVENVAVTDGASERVTLHRGRSRASEEWNVVGADLEGRPTPAELEVTATSLDAYFAGRPLDFVKLDVEGAEASVLRGMRQLLHERKPAMAIEFHTDTGWAGRGELLDAGYRLETLAGEPIDAGPEAQRVYQCLALPS
jgi:FkbM family methyltransferase